MAYFEKTQSKAFINFSRVAQRFEVIKDGQIVGTYAQRTAAEYKMAYENQGKGII